MKTLERQLAEYGERQRELYGPISPDEIVTRGLLAASVDSANGSPGMEVREQSGEDLTVEPSGYALMFDSGWHVDESTAPSERKRWIGALTAVAAAVLVVAGVVVVAARDSGDVLPEAPSSPRVTEPPAPPEQPAARRSVVDSLGYRWSQVLYDDAVFGRAELSDVTAGGPGLVAVGSVGTPDPGTEAAVWTSVDGLTWTRVPHDGAVFGGEGSSDISTVVAGGPGLVAIGGDGDDADGLWTSVDGLTWESASGDVFKGGGPNNVIAGGPGLVAVGENARGAAVWTSADGLAWSRVPHDQEVFGHSVGDGNGMVGVTVGGPGLVAVGSDGLNSDAPTGRAHAVVWTSLDGLTWSRVPHDESVFGGDGDQGMFDVVVGGPGLVAVGENDLGAPVWTSVDGITWTRVPDDEAAFNANTRIFNVTATSAGLMAFGDPGLGYPGVWTSVDGITWARVDDAVFGGAAPTDVTVGGPGLVAVGNRSDGFVWVATPED